jgi:hypothetical protein
MAVGAVTSLDLDAIEKRAERATPGPWKLLNGWEVASGLMRFSRIADAEFDDVVSTDWDSEDLEATRQDAEFIAHAREDVPDLISRIRHLEAAQAGVVEALDDRGYALVKVGTVPPWMEEVEVITRHGGEFEIYSDADTSKPLTFAKLYRPRAES